MFSSLEITFLVDIAISGKIEINNTVNGLQSWKFRDVRDEPFEVVVGTPTALAGEITATNFRNAFDLDNPTGFNTSVVNNKITINSTVTGLDFLSVYLFDNGDLVNGVDYEVTFNNYVAPPDLSVIDLALVRSPFYINVPFASATTTKVTIDLYIWNGDVTNIPANPIETFTRIRPTVDTDSLSVDVSGIVRSFILDAPNIDTASSVQILNSSDDNVKWIHYVASFTDIGATVSDIVGTFSAVDGFGYYNQGINPTKADVLTDVINRKVSSSGIILAPFKNDGTITNVVVNLDGVSIFTQAITTGLQNEEFIKYVCIDVSQLSGDNIQIDFGGVSRNYNYKIVDECIYPAKTIIFKNKNGVFDTLAMFKKSIENLSIERDSYINNYVNNGIYDITDHQFNTINVQGKESIKLNSGFIKEEETELYKQLMLSDKVYFYDGGLIPVNVKTSNFTYKTRVNDRLINYEIEFDYSYNTMQNV